MARAPVPHFDPYVRCEQHCSHDLGRGMSVADLLDADGPDAESRTARDWRNDPYRRSQLLNHWPHTPARQSLS